MTWSRLGKSNPRLYAHYEIDPALCESVNMGSDLMVYELAVQVVASDLAILRMTSPGTCGPVDTPTE